MTKFLSLILILNVLFLANASDVRSDFHAGMFSEDKLLALKDKNTYPKSNLVKAYKGISKTMLADYMFMPTSKLSSFNEGKAELESAIKNEPKNPEFRYLRLLVQLNAPFFLSYNDRINSDISFFTNNLATYKLSRYWKIKFIDNLLAADELTKEHEIKVKALKNKII